MHHGTADGFARGTGRGIGKPQGGPDPPGRGRRVITVDAGVEFRFAERCKGAGLRPEDVVEYRDALLK